MKWHFYAAGSVIAYIMLIQFNGILAHSDGNDLNKAESLSVMALQDPLDDGHFAEDYLNQTKAETEPMTQVSLTELARESRANWQQDKEDRLNRSSYLDLMELVGTQYLEDINYSSYILNEFVNNKIDSREAMTTTMTLFILTKETGDMLDQIDPPSGFEEYQNNSQLALVNLEGYLWNMVKFYETNKRIYATQANDNFNMSMNYYEMVGRSLPKGMI
jgi:hypothetical protein